MTTQHELADASTTRIGHEEDDDQRIAFTNSSNYIRNKEEKNLVRVENKKVQASEITPLQDLIAGGVSGTACVIVGHPFDTFKVRLQLGGTTGGFSSLFKGMAAPASMAAAINAVIFSSFGWSSRIWDTSPALEPYSGYKNFVCGSFSGLVQCLIVCPVDHIKCRLQAQQSTNNVANMSKVPPQNHFRGPYHLTHHILREHGFTSLFRGWNVTCWREVPAFGLYFAFYDSFKKEITKRFFTPDHPHIWGASALAGGLSGTLTWVVVYPFDVVKTRIQTSPFESNNAIDRQIWYAGKHIIKERGVMSMFRGLGVTVVRAFPVNGIIFPVYEFTISQLTK